MKLQKFKRSSRVIGSPKSAQPVGPLVLRRTPSLGVRPLPPCPLPLPLRAIDIDNRLNSCNPCHISACEIQSLHRPPKNWCRLSHAQPTPAPCEHKAKGPDLSVRALRLPTCYAASITSPPSSFLRFSFTRATNAFLARFSDSNDSQTPQPLR